MFAKIKNFTLGLTLAFFIPLFAFFIIMVFTFASLFDINLKTNSTATRADGSTVVVETAADVEVADVTEVTVQDATVKTEATVTEPTEEVAKETAAETTSTEEATA